MTPEELAREEALTDIAAEEGMPVWDEDWAFEEDYPRLDPVDRILEEVGA